MTLFQITEVLRTKIAAGISFAELRSQAYTLAANQGYEYQRSSSDDDCAVDAIVGQTASVFIETTAYGTPIVAFERG